MVMSELFSELDKLGRAEKPRIVQHLVNDLAAEGDAVTFEVAPLTEGTYPLYTPLGNEAAANVLYAMLQAAEAEGRTPSKG